MWIIIATVMIVIVLIYTIWYITTLNAEAVVPSKNWKKTHVKRNADPPHVHWQWILSILLSVSVIGFAGLAVIIIRSQGVSLTPAAESAVLLEPLKNANPPTSAEKFGPVVSASIPTLMSSPLVRAIKNVNDAYKNSV
jgi:hypothetical protein